MSDETENGGTFLLKEKDFVEWVDAEGNALPPVPKHWGADQLPAGATKKSKAAKTSQSGSSSSSGSGTPPTKPEGEPAGNANRDAWAAYATTKGAAEEETKSQDEGGLSRDDLRTKYGTPAS